MYKLIINEYYSNFKNFILNIDEKFNQNQNTIHKARNELKIINYNDIDTVVKSFKIPNILRRIVYTYFRDTKAKKSYDYSLKIGGFTPKPIGYIEFYEDKLLTKSYFISEKFEYDFTIREPLLQDNFRNKVEILKEFANFTYKLHQNNILHKDYSPGNILIKQEDDKFIFKIVDINRMEFKPLSFDECIKNFNKLWAKDSDLIVVLTQYAKISNNDIDECLQIGLKYNQQLKNKVNMKKRFKGIKVVD